MKQGGTTESQVKGEIHERMTNNQKRRSLEFPENGNVGVPEFSGNGKHRKFRSFRKSNINKYTYLGNSPEFRVVLEPWERILTMDVHIWVVFVLMFIHILP